MPLREKINCLVSTRIIGSKLLMLTDICLYVYFILSITLVVQDQQSVHVSVYPNNNFWTKWPFYTYMYVFRKLVYLVKTEQKTVDKV